MPRPTRIEYEGAFYHVMNRGRNHADIFHDQCYFNEFLKCLQEASEQFDAVFHAYCLMSNHYQLLLETPKANLARIMRHVNGVYTQRYNWLKKTDGSLFKGRYKSVLVDEDEYLLRLTRYIHLNPIETKKPMVSNLADYEWSSYPAYINEVKAPEWLHRDKTYQMLGHKQRFKGYRDYVAQGVDEDLSRYYNRFNILSVLGSADFKEQALKTFEETNIDEVRMSLNNKPCADEIIKLVCQCTKTKQLSLISKPKGRRSANPSRAFAMYACRRYGDCSQKQLAEAFELQHIGSAAFSINKVKNQIREGKWRNELDWLERNLGIVKSA